MNNLPNPLWAFLILCLGVAVIVLVLLHPSHDATVNTAVIAFASAIGGGAFAYLNHAAGVSAASTFPDQPKK